MTKKIENQNEICMQILETRKVEQLKEIIIKAMKENNITSFKKLPSEIKDLVMVSCGSKSNIQDFAAYGIWAPKEKYRQFVKLINQEIVKEEVVLRGAERAAEENAVLGELKSDLKKEKLEELKKDQTKVK